MNPLLISSYESIVCNEHRVVTLIPDSSKQYVNFSIINLNKQAFSNHKLFLWMVFGFLISRLGLFFGMVSFFRYLCTRTNMGRPWLWFLIVQAWHLALAHEFPNRSGFWQSHFYLRGKAGCRGRSKYQVFRNLQLHLSLK